MERGSNMTVAWIAAATRLMALWLAVNVLIALPAFIAQWRIRDTNAEGYALFTAGMAVGLVRFIGTIVVAALLWTTNHALAERVWQPVESNDDVAPPVVDLQSAILAAIGIYLVVSGVPSIAELAYRYYSLPPRFELQESPQLTIRAIGGVVDVAVGVALVLRARGLTNLLDRIRRSSDHDVEDNDAEPNE
jgi:hypothetical protein